MAGARHEGTKALAAEDEFYGERQWAAASDVAYNVLHTAAITALAAQRAAP